MNVPIMTEPPCINLQSNFFFTLISTCLMDAIDGPTTGSGHLYFILMVLRTPFIVSNNYVIHRMNKITKYMDNKWMWMMPNDDYDLDTQLYNSESINEINNIWRPRILSMFEDVYLTRSAAEKIIREATLIIVAHSEKLRLNRTTCIVRENYKLLKDAEIATEDSINDIATMLTDPRTIISKFNYIILRYFRPVDDIMAKIYRSLLDSSTERAMIDELVNEYEKLMHKMRANCGLLQQNDENDKKWQEVGIEFMKLMHAAVSSKRAQLWI